MKGEALTLLGALLLIVILVVVLCIITKPSKPSISEPYRIYTSVPRKEGFFNAAGGAYVDENTKTIKGNMILTDQMVFGHPSSDLLEGVREDHYYAEPGTLGATENTKGFNKLLANQLAIQNINNKNDGNVMSQNDMKEINKKLISSANNSRFNLFDRSGSKNIRFSVEPSGTRAVIDGDYLGDRDKNHDVTAVRRVIPVQSFDISIDRIPQQIIKQRGSTLGVNKERNKLRVSGEGSLKGDMTSEVIEMDNSNKSMNEVKENFNKYRGSGGIFVDGNYNN